MEYQLEPGRYIVAVSGGVDSMALLHLLHNRPELKLTVAHFDHGIRPDSRRDRLLVQKTARQYGLPFVFFEGQLGKGSSEEAARNARYTFLHSMRQKLNADAVVTAHHRDDVLETAIINMIRGTGRKGLSSLKSIDVVKRPLLHLPKKDLRSYAADQGLVWHEDSTNADPTYLRNHIRHNVLTKFSDQDIEKLHAIILRQKVVNHQVDLMLEEVLQRLSYGTRLKRQEFILLPHAIALEVMATWLRKNHIRSFDKKLLERLVRAAKIHAIGKLVPIGPETNLRIEREFLALVTMER